MNPKNYARAVTRRLGRAQVAFERLTYHMDQSHLSDFMADPKQFLINSLEAAGRPVKDLNIGADDLNTLIANVRKSALAPVPFKQVTVTAHVYSPPEAKSQHIKLIVVT